MSAALSIALNRAVSALTSRVAALLSVPGALALSLTGCMTPGVVPSASPGISPGMPVRPLPTVAAVDLTRYAGTWYEVAALPNRFQAQCVADTQAHYRALGADIEVRNRCRKADGSVDEATGVAKVVAGSGNAKLRVSFFRPIYGDYWVLALAPDYRWALVGEPGRRFGWVLSRAPRIAPEDLDAALARAEALGYARSAFRATPQRQPLPLE